jgi:two-component SAPR family response regulator
MPLMKGDELAVKVKKLSPSLPIVMITAYSVRVSERDNPVDTILSKPFEFEDLRRALAQLLS